MTTALITGGSSGMGLEYARQLAKKGCLLILVSNQQEQLDNAAAELKENYPSIPDVVTIWSDLARVEAADKLHRLCSQKGIIPDILVCNAGMFFFKELTGSDVNLVSKMLTLHIETNTRLCLLFGEDMKRRGSGRIIIMASMAAKLPTPGITIYSATKAYLMSFGKSLWFEMKPYGVSVTTICPAAVATPLYNLKPSLMKLGVRLGAIHTPEWLVKRALRASKHSRRVVRPSLMNWYLPELIRLIPAPVESRIWKKLK